MLGRLHSRASEESGLTLIELLVATLILGTAVVAILGAYMTGILGSSLHRQQASVHSIVVDASEQLQAATWKSDCSYTITLPSQYSGKFNAPDYSCATAGRIQTFNVTATSVADGQSESLTLYKYNKGN